MGLSLQISRNSDLGLPTKGMHVVYGGGPGEKTREMWVEGSTQFLFIRTVIELQCSTTGRTHGRAYTTYN